MGWAWHPRNTRLTPTRHVEAGEAGGDFWGDHMRHYPTQSTRGDTTIITPSREAMARHPRQIGAVVRRQRRVRQARLLAALQPVLRGWRHDDSPVGSHETGAPRDAQRRQQLRSWSRLRHPRKPLPWGDQQYWRGEAGPWHGKPRAPGQR
jgi:RNA-directed DNA polymerase